MRLPAPTGFSSCEDPAALQAICDRFAPRDIERFFARWTAVITTPLTDADRAAGYWWDFSMRQVEVSRTMVFDDPRRARGFFESLVTARSRSPLRTTHRPRTAAPLRCRS